MAVAAYVSLIFPSYEERDDSCGAPCLWVPALHPAVDEDCHELDRDSLCEVLELIVDDFFVVSRLAQLHLLQRPFKLSDSKGASSGCQGASSGCQGASSGCQGASSGCQFENVHCGCQVAAIAPLPETFCRTSYRCSWTKADAFSLSFLLETAVVFCIVMLSLCKAPLYRYYYCCGCCSFCYLVTVVYVVLSAQDLLAISVSNRKVAHSFLNIS